MIVTNPIREVAHYGSAALYHDLPTPDQVRAGVLPLDSLPAAWWNGMWCDTNEAVNEARSAVGTLVTEINNAITRAGCTPDPSICNQLYQAIEKIRQTIGNAVYAGAVKSSSTDGQVSIDNNGTMTVNGVGNANYLTTTSHTIVTALNEIKSTYNNCFSNVYGCADGVSNSRAPSNHVSSALTYGAGSASNYGHLKISDAIGQASDVAASQSSVYDLYALINEIGGGLVCCANRVSVTPSMMVYAVIQACENYWRTTDTYCKGIIAAGTGSGYKTLVGSEFFNPAAINTDCVKLHNSCGCLTGLYFCGSNFNCNQWVRWDCSGGYLLSKWGDVSCIGCVCNMMTCMCIPIAGAGGACIYYWYGGDCANQLCICGSASCPQDTRILFLINPVKNTYNCTYTYSGRTRYCCVQMCCDDWRQYLCARVRRVSSTGPGTRYDMCGDRRCPYMPILRRVCTSAISCLVYRKRGWTIGITDDRNCPGGQAWACSNMKLRPGALAMLTNGAHGLNPFTMVNDPGASVSSYFYKCCGWNITFTDQIRYEYCHVLGKLIHTPTTTGR